MSLKCSLLSVTYHKEALSYRHSLYFAYFSLCLRLGLFMYYLCDLFFHYHFHFHNNHDLIEKDKLVLRSYYLKFSLRVFLGFCLSSFYLPISAWCCLWKCCLHKKARICFHLTEQFSVIIITSFLFFFVASSCYVALR